MSPKRLLHPLSLVILIILAPCFCTSEILVNKTIKIGKTGNENDIITKVLKGSDINLLKIEVEGECDMVDPNSHVSAIAEVDHQTLMTYITACDKKKFVMQDQTCANETNNIHEVSLACLGNGSEGELKVIVLGAHSTSHWKISRDTPLPYNGESISRILSYVPRRSSSSSSPVAAAAIASSTTIAATTTASDDDDDNTNYVLDSSRSKESKDWQSVQVLEVDVNNFDTKERILQFTVTSNEEGQGLFVVSRDCANTIDPSSLENVEIHVRPHDTMHLTFNKFGRITLSRVSTPPLGKGIWFVHVLITGRLKTAKNVTLTVESIYNYPHGQIWLAGILAFLLGVSAVFLYYALVSDLPGLTVLFKGMKRESVTTTMANWFKRGNKSFSYITAVFAITFAVGGYQVVHGNWQKMIESGDRDICFYNERCYIPSTKFEDYPFNLLSSNIPYAVHGVVIFLAFGFRESYCYNKGHFGYYDYSLAYAISWSFIFEGIFSTIYHKCPTRMIFQFDTAFMFTISSLIVSALFNHYSITDEDMLLLHNRIPPKDLDLQLSNTRALRAPKVFFFFLAPILLFNYMGSLRDVGQLSFPHEVIGSIFLILWFLFIIIWGAFKLEVLPNRVNAKPKLKDPRIEPIKGQMLTYFAENPALLKRQQQETPSKRSLSTPSKRSTQPPVVEQQRQGVTEDPAVTATILKGDEQQKPIREAEDSVLQVECIGGSNTNDINAAAVGSSNNDDAASTSTASFFPNGFSINNFCRVFSFPMLYVVVSGLLFIWLLLSIFQRRDLSVFFLGTCIGSVFISMMALEFSVIRESSQRMLRNSGTEFKALRKSRTLKKILKVLGYYHILGVVWIAAGYFFIGLEVSNKSSTPSENRDLNDPCMLLNFYDSHDIWHFLSSCGLLLSGIRAIALSFPCRYCRMETLKNLVERDKKLFVVKMEAAMQKIKILKNMRDSNSSNGRGSIDA